MGLLDRFNKQDTTPPTASAPAGPVSLVKGGSVSLVKGGSVSLDKQVREYTLIATWGRKDYDLYALVEYWDGHVEVVSCFGTTAAPAQFSTRTSDSAVVHVSGDKATTDRGGSSLPQEVIHITLNDKIRSVVPVVYSAQNSGTGSFHHYRVSTYVIEGRHTQVPGSGVTQVAVEAAHASRNPLVYSFVPAIIHNTPEGARVEAVELYSRSSSEKRPTVRGGVLTMDSGPENAYKYRPNG